LALVWLLALSNRGINMADEGVQVLYGHQIANGAITYLDYYVPVAPLGFLIQAALIKLFGFHLIIGRLYAVLQGMLIVAMALDLGRRYLRSPFSLAPGLLYVFFGAALAGFPHYNMDAAFFMLGSFYFACLYMEKGGLGLAFATGLLGSLSVCSKQSMAMTAFVLVALSVYMAHRRGRKLIRPAVAGLSGLALPVVLLFVRYARHHALEEAGAALFGLVGMKRVVLFHIIPPAAGIILASLVLIYIAIRASGRWREAWPVMLCGGALAALLIIALAPGNFSAPLVCAVAALSLLVFVSPDKDHHFWTLARVVWGLFFVFSALSGLDLAHVLIAVAGAPFMMGLFLQKSSEKGEAGLRYAAAGIFVLILGLGAYADIAVPHIKYLMEPRWRATSKIDLAGLECIRVPPHKAREIEKTVKWIKEHSAEEEKIFVYPWDLLLYVFADRMPATYDTFLYFEIFDRRTAERVVRDLEKEKPAIAVVAMEGDRVRHQAFAGQAGMIEGYLKSRYDKAVRFGDYRIMVRKTAEGTPAQAP